MQDPAVLGTPEIENTTPPNVIWLPNPSVVKIVKVASSPALMAALR
jgi:hypothetical protein